MSEKSGGCGCSCGAGACAPGRTGAGIMKTDTVMRWRDRLGVVRVRLGIRRNQYQVTPGLYALGAPGPASPVFVSANYKLSFDVLRTSLVGLDAWILALDTRGVNVWCAAGKGTFGTAELIAKVRETGLSALLDTRELIVPQLGAPGVAAHEVEKATGFKVVFGPVRSADIKEFLRRGKTATGDMRRVRFNLADRAKLVPVEGAGVLKYLLIGAVVVAGVAFIASGFTLSRTLAAAAVNLAGVALALAGGTILTPLLLPWLPGRSFSLKGFIAGAALGIAFALLAGKGALEGAAWTLLSAAASSFFAMGFTGASTYTNLSGTVREMRRYIPLQIGAAAAGALCFIVPAVVTAVRG
jgi:hypothetical protein